jgi:maleate isomerase
MYGWRARIGTVVTSDDTTVDSEFSKTSPEGVSIHGTRMMSSPGVSSEEELHDLKNYVEQCAELLRTTNVDVVAYCCTTGSLIEGPGYELELEEKISEIAETSCVTTAASIKRAFDALGVESLVVTTPYTDEVNQREARYLEESGYTVVDIGGFRLDNPPSPYTAARPERAYREARAIDDDDADAIFISCTGYRTFEIIEKLERDLNKPVITSNQATLWDALRKAGVDYNDVELGELLDL